MVSHDGRDDLADWLREGWRPRDERVVLEAPRVLRGVVLDADGDPVVGAEVRWQGPGVHWRSTRRTGEDGRFVFENAPPVPLRVTALPPGAWREEWTPPEVVAAPGDRDLVLRLARAGTIRVRVTSAPREGLEVHLVSEPVRGERRTWSRTLADGEAVFDALVPGRRYEVLVADGEDGRAARRAGVEPGGSVTLRLERGLVIAGRIELPEGAGDPWVYARREGVSVRGEVSEGRYEVRGLVPGTWTLSAGAECRWGWPHVRVEAVAGTSRDLVVPGR
jgi:hypothetical protein